VELGAGASDDLPLRQQVPSCDQGQAVDLPRNGHHSERIDLLGQIANKIVR